MNEGEANAISVKFLLCKFKCRRPNNAQTLGNCIIGHYWPYEGISCAVAHCGLYAENNGIKVYIYFQNILTRKRLYKIFSQLTSRLKSSYCSVVKPKLS